ncbi:hypothetical protein EG329_011256 [Mollisiaceae sp. DMI_Dod_QoI]|nr:hypothetical protein EG329_011256 [Helotiales sp. DMI_Dod_QoI]
MKSNIFLFILTLLISISSHTNANMVSISTLTAPNNKTSSSTTATKAQATSSRGPSFIMLGSVSEEITAYTTFTEKVSIVYTDSVTSFIGFWYITQVDPVIYRTTTVVYSPNPTSSPSFVIVVPDTPTAIPSNPTPTASTSSSKAAAPSLEAGMRGLLAVGLAALL